MMSNLNIPPILLEDIMNTLNEKFQALETNMKQPLETQDKNHEAAIADIPAHLVAHTAPQPTLIFNHQPQLPYKHPNDPMHPQTFHDYPLI
ncbi:hypothetical protein Scep_004458 [Stephania cephalantha]|uniref:Uncharacterized protein n=1 Tax=Stephania cephalantha TaxID=152367 RepID=A0AAP0PXB5_9MAGN